MLSQSNGMQCIENSFGNIFIPKCHVKSIEISQFDFDSCHFRTQNERLFVMNRNRCSVCWSQKKKRKFLKINENGLFSVY